MSNYGSISYLAQICEQCGREYLPANTGRPQRYCSGACRQRAYRFRQTLARMEAWATEFRNTASGPGGGAAQNVTVDDSASVTKLVF